MVGKRGTRAEVAAKWRERLGRWQRLQCSITEFCRREGISQPSFFHWRRRLATANAKPANSVAPRGAAFIPVQVVAQGGTRSSSRSAGAPGPDQGTWFEIAAGELVCRLPAHLDEPTLRRLVRVLSEEVARC